MFDPIAAARDNVETLREAEAREAAEAESEVYRTDFLRSKLTKEFMEYDQIIEMTLFESLIDFWDRDNGRESLYHNSHTTAEHMVGVGPGTGEENAKAYNASRIEAYEELSAAYDFIKRFKRFKANYHVEHCYNEVTPQDFYPVGFNWAQQEDPKVLEPGQYCFEQPYMRTDTEFYFEADKHLENILKHRNRMWT